MLGAWALQLRMSCPPQLAGSLALGPGPNTDIHSAGGLAGAFQIKPGYVRCTRQGYE